MHFRTNPHEISIHSAAMNVLFLHSCRTWGGGEVWLSQIVEALRGRGHEVTVVCHPGSALHRRMWEWGSALVPVKISGDFNPVTIARFYRLIKVRGIGLVCVHTEKEMRVGGLAARLAGVPLVISREVDVPIKSTRLNRFFYRRVAAAVIANSFATKNTLLDSVPWLPEERIAVIWKGVDVAQHGRSDGSQLRTEFGAASQDVLIGFVGRLDEQKGIRTLLEAMPMLVARNRHVRLVFAGDGNLRQTVEQFRAAQGLDSQIYLAGFRKDIPEFLEAIDILVMPSNWEGFGYAAAEAMAAGKPVVASRVSSLPEVVEEGRTGLLVPPRSPEALAKAILTLVENPSLRRSMGLAGAARVRRMFTVEAMADKVEALFLKIVQLDSTSAVPEPSAADSLSRTGSSSGRNSRVSR